MSDYAVISLATGTKYVQYWKDLVLSFHSSNIDLSKFTFYILTDDVTQCKLFAKTTGIKLRAHQIPSYDWPEATLLRYREIMRIQKDISENVLVYLDADMLIQADFSGDLTPTKWRNGIALVSHPGYWRPRGIRRLFYYAKSPSGLFKDIFAYLRIGGLGSWEIDPTSTAFVPRKLRKRYVCGGTWMGIRSDFLKMVSECSRSVDIDLERNFIAKWHDESHLNKWKSEHEVEILSPSYCFDPTYRNLRGLKEMIRAVRK